MPAKAALLGKERQKESLGSTEQPKARYPLIIPLFGQIVNIHIHIHIIFLCRSQSPQNALRAALLFVG